MTRARLAHSLARRADQAGSLAGLGFVPLTFQRTLMPRSTIDQALVTGLTVATNRALVSLVQESIQAGALLSIGGSRRAHANPALWSKVTLGLDVAAIGAGIAVQRKLARQPREPLPRASARTAGYWLTLAGTAGAIIGTLQEARTRRRPGGRSGLVVVPAAGALAAFGEYRRRQAAHQQGDLPADDSQVTTVKALGLGLGVAAGMSLMSVVEHAMANGLARRGRTRAAGARGAVATGRARSRARRARCAALGSSRTAGCPGSSARRSRSSPPSTSRRRTRWCRDASRAGCRSRPPRSRGAASPGRSRPRTRSGP